MRAWLPSRTIWLYLLSFAGIGVAVFAGPITTECALDRGCWMDKEEHGSALVEVGAGLAAGAVIGAALSSIDGDRRRREEERETLRREAEREREDARREAERKREDDRRDRERTADALRLKTQQMIADHDWYIDRWLDLMSNERSLIRSERNAVGCRIRQLS